MSYISDLHSAITEAVHTVAGCKDVPGFQVLPTPDAALGHAATNVAMILARQLGRSPLSIAEEVAACLRRETWLARVDVASPGYVNVFFQANYVRDTLRARRILKPGRAERTVPVTRFSTGRVLVEHTSPTFPKALHIGHLMNNAIGEFIVRSARLSKPDTAQSDVLTMSFPSDISPSFGKALFIFRRTHSLVELQRMPPEMAMELLGACYAQGVAAETDEPGAAAEIKRLMHQLYNAPESEEAHLYRALLSVCDAYLKAVASQLGSSFDLSITESAAGMVGKDLVLSNIAPGKFEHSDGAVVHIPTQPDTHTAVFVNGQGNPTYDAKDLGLLQLKWDRLKPERSLSVVDREQEGHFKTVFSAARALGGDLARMVERSEFVFHGRMSLKGQRMSSRLGGVPLAHDVLRELAERARGIAEQRLGSAQEPLSEATTAMLAISAVKIAILRSKPGLNLNLDPDTSLSFDGDSGPYVQYTHARCCSVLARARKCGLLPDVSVRRHGDVSKLELTLLEWEAVVQESIDTLSPQRVVTFVMELSNAFNSFYAQSTIVDVTQPALSAERLALVAMTRDTLEAALYVLGLDAIDHM